MSAAAAREPAALVLELAAADGVPPPPCAGVVVGAHTLFLASELLAEGKTGATRLHRLGGLAGLEGARVILVQRGLRRCDVFLAAQPPRAFPRGAEAGEAGPRLTWRWREGDAVEVLRASGKKRRLAPGQGWCMEPARAPMEACRLRIHHYGRLALYLGAPQSKTQEGDPGAAVSMRFAGPGETARFRLTPAAAGTLVVEYRSSTGPGSVDIAITDADGTPLGSGSAALAAGASADVAFTYRGSGPAQVDAGFLYTEAGPLACRLTVESGDASPVVAALVLENTGSEAVVLPQPGPGSVRWYAGDVLIAAAVPGRPARRLVLPPGGRHDYRTTLTLPAGARRLRAEIDAGALGRLSCGPITLGGPGEHP